MAEMSSAQTTHEDHPPNRYDARLANEIEARWQARWEREHTFYTPNPTGDLSVGFEHVADRPKLFVLDMFPYPSGSGVHVGHPLGFIATDVYSRYKRMAGFNVLHTMGFDAFGLPAEEYARQTGQHPRVTTEAIMANMRRQLRALGLAHDPRRSIATIDPDYYKWTQWIFLQIFESWYDPDLDRARPISEMVAELESGERTAVDAHGNELDWSSLGEGERRDVIDGYRLAYLDEAAVNWCPALGTVLANEEVTAEGRSERGNHPVYRRELKQWKMRITSYARRLLDDLDSLDWPDPIKTMQRNWIGRSEGAHMSFPTDGPAIEVFTTRPDTVFGATYMVLAPEHPLVDELMPEDWPEGTPASWTGGTATPADAVGSYREAASRKSDLERQAEARDKTGVFIGAYARNFAADTSIPIFVADYVLMGYGTGAIMAVPGEDERDWEFAETFGLPILRTVQPPEDFEGGAYTGEGPSINSGFLDGMDTDEAKSAVCDWLEREGHGRRTVTYKLRDWLFSRQRYWGEPFPIVFDSEGRPHGLPEEMLPVELPDVDDYAPRPVDDPEATPETPLSRAENWETVELDLGDGVRTYTREMNTMPNWAGSCWYYLRYLDPTNDEALVDPEVDRYWMLGDGKNTGGVDLYVGGVEHAVLHLIYARFWHQVLYDLGHVSTPEPFQRLLNQGYIQAYAFTDERGVYVEASEVVESDGRYSFRGRPVTREYGKMGKSLKNAVTPDEICEAYGADTLRLYEMSMGPLDQDRPWDTTAIVGSQRLLQRVWRCVVDETTGAPRVTEDAPDDVTRRELHRTIAAVTEDMDGLRFNTAVAEITKLTNHLTKELPDRPTPREVAEALVLMISPLAPHVAEQMWSVLGHPDSLFLEPFPVADPSLLVAETLELPVQVDGKVRGKVTVPADASDEMIEQAAREVPNVAEHLGDRKVAKVIVVPGRLVNIVLG